MCCPPTVAPVDLLPVAPRAMKFPHLSRPTRYCQMCPNGQEETCSAAHRVPGGPTRTVTDIGIVELLARLDWEDSRCRVRHTTGHLPAGQGFSKAHAYPLSFQVQAYAGITHAGAGETPAFPVGAVTLTPAPVSSTGQALSRQGRGDRSVVARPTAGEGGFQTRPYGTTRSGGSGPLPKWLGS